MNKREALTQARMLVTDPERWTQNAEARSECGSQVSPKGDKAISYCMLGALRRVCGSNGDLFNYTCISLRESLDSNAITRFNDRHTHAEVLAAFDKAISEADK